MLEFTTGSEKSLSYLKEISDINKKMKEKKECSWEYHRGHYEGIISFAFLPKNEHLCVSSLGLRSPPKTL